MIKPRVLAVFLLLLVGLQLFVARPLRSAPELPGNRGPVVIPQVGHTGNTFALAISPDSKTIASASSDRSIKLWDTSRAMMVATLEGHLGGVSTLSFSPDGRWLASAGGDSAYEYWGGVQRRDFDIRIWDIARRQVAVTLVGHVGLVTALAFSPDGRLLASRGQDGTLRLWDVSTVEKGERFTPIATSEKAEGLFELAFSPAGDAIALAGNGQVQIWGLDLAKPKLTLDQIETASNQIAFNHDGTRLAVAGSTVHVEQERRLVESRVGIWDTTTGKLLEMVSGFRYPIVGVAFDAGGQNVVFNDPTDGLVRWQPGTRLTAPEIGDGEELPFGWSVVRSADGKFFASGGPGITVWDANTLRPVWTAGTDGTEAKVLSVAPGGGRMLTVHKGILSLVDVSRGQRRTSPTGPGNEYVRFWFSRDARWGVSQVIHRSPKQISGQAYYSEIWDTVALRRRLTLPDTHVDDVAFSPNGKLLAVANMRPEVQLWDLPSLKPRNSIACSVAAISVAFSPNGKRLAVGCVDRVEVWDVETRQRVLVTDGFKSLISALAFSPDGQTVAAGSGRPEQYMMHAGRLPSETTIRLWSVKTGKLQGVCQGHTLGVSGVAFSPDGSWLASVADDHRVNLWDARTCDRLLTAPGAVGRDASLYISPAGNRILAWGQGGPVRMWDLAGKQLLAFFALAKGDWLTFGLEGHVDAPPGRTPLVAWESDGHIWPFEHFKEQRTRDLWMSTWMSRSRGEKPVLQPGQVVNGCRIAPFTQCQNAVLDMGALPGADLTKAGLEGAHMSGADLSQAYMSEAQLGKALLRGARLDGADLQGADLESADLTGASLRHALMSLAKLSDAQLSGADMSHADLDWADLTHAHLNNAILIGAHLHKTRLEQADLRGANLSEAWLDGVRLEEADLENANLSGTLLVSIQFYNTKLKGVNFSHTSLRSVDSLAHMDLSGANFSYANLSRVGMVGADLTNANLTGANIQGTDLEQVQLSGARWIDGKKICAKGSIGKCQ